MRQFLKKIKIFLCANHNTCRIVDFDVEKQEVIFRLAMKSPVFRLPIIEAIYHSGLVDLLAPLEACWLGGYYGRHISASFQAKTTTPPDKQIKFLWKDSQAQYRVMSLNRHQDICYCDQKNKKIFTESALSIANNRYIISKFNATQACYIGVLAGLMMQKTRIPQQMQQKTPPLATLRLVTQ
jgi:hypothetical protein